jgi:glyoxylate reductase
MDREALDSGKDLKVIANYAVGYDNIDVEYATRKNIAILNTPGVLTDATADLAFSLLLASARKIGESERYVRKGNFRSWGPELMLGKDVWGATLGVIGAGQIGEAVLRRGKGFEMELLYHSRSPKPRIEKELDASYVPLEELLRRSDFISLNCPLTPETRHLIGKEELLSMKEDAILINTSRGPVIDENALVEALRNGWIGGAGLDVYEWEPKVHPDLLEMENVVLAPHIGSATHTTRNKMASMASEGILKLLSGSRPENIVNPEVLE